MTIEDLSKQISNLGAKFDSIDARFDSIDARFDSIDAKFDSIDNKFDSIGNKFDSIDNKFNSLDAKFDSLEAKVEDGFNASKIREDEILGVARLGLEANEILRDEMNRRFDASDKHMDAQISLLKSAIRSDAR